MDLHSHSNNKELIDPNELGSHCQRFKNNNQNLQKNGKVIEDTVKKYTANEVQAVEEAIKKLNAKIEKIIAHPKMDEFKTTSETLQKEIFQSLEYIIKIFEIYRKWTLERKDLTSEEKMRNIKLAFNKIQGELFTQEEIDMFKKQFENIIIMPPKRTSYKNQARIKNMS